MQKSCVSLIVSAVFLVTSSAVSIAADSSQKAGSGAARESALSKPQNSITTGSVTVEGKRIDYKAVAGTIILHGTGDKEDTPTANIFYVAYFKRDADPARRPVTFLYNGGPGGSSFPLHMGAFGPRRVQAGDHTHTPAAPYDLVNNDYSLLDVSDVVFIDAPGTGFSRLIAATDKDKREATMKQRAKHFFSVDGDAQAFARFITRFLSQYGRWNSPKYLFGESYGTTRSALVANVLENKYSVDLNGVVLLSQILNFDTSVDDASANPGVDLPYALALPTYAATAWYHHKLPDQPEQLQPLLHDVEQFAMGPYAQALQQGDLLDAAHKQQIATQLHRYTGLPVAFLLKANLRVDGGVFEHELLADSDTITGRLDTRFSGPGMDPLGKEVEYDPLISGIGSAYVSLFNDYVRKTLKFGKDRQYRMFDMQAIKQWDYRHRSANGDRSRATNVMPDLAQAMEANPNLKVMMAGGYFDLGTPFYAAEFELNHLAIPSKLHDNISVHLYESGHMVYVHVPALKKLHADVADFIRATYSP